MTQSPKKDRPASERNPSRLAPGRRSLFRRILSRLHRRDKQTSTSQTMLPVLMRVFAGFSKIDGRIESDEIDSSLDVLRYDYPEAVYSELRQIYLQALQEPQDLNQIAAELSEVLKEEDKILLGVQLYTLISHSGRQRDQLVAFYLFMTNLGIASQAIDIVYQLNTGETLASGEGDDLPQLPVAKGTMETIAVGQAKPADVVFPKLSANCRLLAFRFQNLVMLKNNGQVPILVRGRRILPGEFCRLFAGQRVLMEEIVIDHADFLFYFNAKKDLQVTQLYLSVGENGEVSIEESRGKGTHLLVKFGLGVRVEALRDTPASLQKRALTRGTVREAYLDDTLQFDNGREIAFSELRRRARELGGKFRLEASKTEYLISNDAARLRPGDILLSGPPNEPLLLRIICNHANKNGVLEIIESKRPIYASRQLVKQEALVMDGDIVTIGEGQFLRCHFTDGVIEEQRNVIRSLDARDITHRYYKDETAVDSVSFTARRGEMICVMGPSGCGKSTLLRVLAGQLKPSGGDVAMNGMSLYKNHDNLTPYICYIPHEDAFDPLLTVEENIDFSAAIRCPDFKEEDRKKRADGKLMELGLNEARHRLAGLPEEKRLSGGERKRLNAGLDMISLADVYLFDEPTSGLSSKDSEHVLEIIRALADNKIVLVSIHQPSGRLFNMFHKAILLDKGGKLVYFGTPQGILEYFWSAWMQENGRNDPMPPQGTLTPDFIFDVLETPLRDVSGDVIYEQSAEGHLTAARRFPPHFWRDRYQTHQLLENVGEQSASNANDSSGETPPESRQPPQRPQVSWAGEWTLFSTMLKRALLSKFRNKGNLFTSLLEAPALALLISVVLRYSEEDKFTFASAFHIPTYLFLSLVVAMFLGLTNSADEIIRDRLMLLRERNHNVRIAYYILGKFTALGTFAMVQCVVYLFIGNLILGVRDMFFGHLLWMFLTSLTGVALGLIVSSIVRDSKTALNFIPVILIPQILLGGALIKYEEMNKNLDFIYSLRLIPNLDDEAVEVGTPVREKEMGVSRLKVPLICEFMPLRWTYESIIITQAKYNPLTYTQDWLEQKITDIVSPPGTNPGEVELTEAQEDKLDTYKEALALVSGIEERNTDAVRRRLHRIFDALDADEFRLEKFRPKSYENAVTGDEVYVNRKTMDLVTKAELERNDYRLAPGTNPNVFFGTEKQVLGILIDTRVLNFLVMVGTIGVILVILGFVLKRQLSRV